MEDQIYTNTGKRPSLNLIKYQEKYGPDQDEFHIDGMKSASSGVLSSIRKKLKKRRLKPSKSCMGDFILERFPFINMLRNYKLNYLLKDLISGLTVGVIQIAPSNNFS